MTKGKTPKAKVESASDEELYSISRLAEYFAVDRATMRKRLDAAGMKPVKESAKEKLYRLEDGEAAMSEAGESDELDEAKLRKLNIEADLKELELQQAREEVVPRREVEDYAQKLFTAMFQRVGVRFPKEIAPQLVKAENAAQITEILRTSLGQIFNDLRDDHSRFLSSDSPGDS